jgi:hypothetical protein
MQLATRTSARQVQRIQRRNQPQPHTPRISGGIARWTGTSNKSEERKLFEKLVAYLYIDPLRDGAKNFAQAGQANDANIIAYRADNRQAI